MQAMDGADSIIAGTQKGKAGRDARVAEE